jgi:hypothetical protein
MSVQYSLVAGAGWMDRVTNRFVANNHVVSYRTPPTAMRRGLAADWLPKDLLTDLTPGILT